MGLVVDILFSLSATFSLTVLAFSDCLIVGKFVKAPAINKLSTQELWQAYFANPTDWWDNRKNKVVD